MKFGDIKLAIDEAKSIINKLKIKYPSFRGYPVFSSRLGQANLKNDKDLVVDFPKMFIPDQLVNEFLKLNSLKTFKDLKEENTAKNRAVEILNQLSVKDDVFVELRFEQLNFELIELLKKDPLISAKYTIEELRSIAIVLFRVNDLRKLKLIPE